MGCIERQLTKFQLLLNLIDDSIITYHSRDRETSGFLDRCGYIYAVLYYIKFKSWNLMTIMS